MLGVARFLGLGDLAGEIVSTFFRVLAQWAAGAASWFLGLVGHLLGSSTTPPVGTSWFLSEQQVLLSVAAPIALLALVGAALFAVLRGDLSSLWRTVLLRLPIAALLGAGAAGIVVLALHATDDVARQLSSSTGASLGTSVQSLAGEVVAQGALGTAPSFFVGILVIVGAVALWFELVVRAAAITVITASLPLVLAAGLWPPAVPWVRRVADTLGALIVSKVLIVLVLVIALDSITHGNEGASSVVTGGAMLLLASFAPYAVLRLVPVAEAAALSHLESLRHRATAAGTAVVTRGSSLLLGGDDPAHEGTDPVGTDPIGMAEGIDVDLTKGTVLDPDATFDRPRRAPVVPVPLKHEHHRLELDQSGLPRLVYRPPWGGDA